MKLALSLAWRLALAFALVANPLVGLGSAAAMALATPVLADAPCHESMEAQAPVQEKPNTGCTHCACDIGACVGTGALYVPGIASDWQWLRLDLLPVGAQARAAIAPPQARLIRPPIA